MKISDIIENFILDIIGDGKRAEISRNELASYFKCAPSQINYVLQTRFTVDRGFMIESQRGGGGYIRIEKICAEREPYLCAVLASAEEPMSHTRVKQIVDNMTKQKILTENEGALIAAATSDKALASPNNIADTIRSNILRETVLHLLKR